MYTTESELIDVMQIPEINHWSWTVWQRSINPIYERKERLYILSCNVDKFKLTILEMCCMCGTTLKILLKPTTLTVEMDIGFFMVSRGHLILKTCNIIPTTGIGKSEFRVPVWGILKNKVERWMATLSTSSHAFQNEWLVKFTISNQANVTVKEKFTN